MSTPIIIPAFNEERQIAATLRSLPAEGTRPIVAVNGSSDRTAEIARAFGVEVLDYPDQGKLPALQQAVERLDEAAMEPLIILDADTQPVFAKAWLHHMIRLLHPEKGRPSVVAGPVVFTDEAIASGAVRSMRRAQYAMRYRHGGERPGRFPVAGPNMGLYLANQQALQQFFDLPHFWPREDQAIANVVTTQGGTYLGSLHPALLARTRSSSSYLGVKERWEVGRAEAQARTFQAYVDRGAPGSEPYQGR